MANIDGTVDFRGVDAPMFDLEKRRVELETIVAPAVTSNNTGMIIGFKGKRRYLDLAKLPAGGMHAVLALQSLYRMEAARKAGQIDELIRLTIVFAGQLREVDNLHWWKTTSVEGMAMHTRKTSSGPASMRAAKVGVDGDRKRDNRDEAHQAIARMRDRFPSRAEDIDFLKEKAAAELNISKRTLNRRLK